MRARLSARAESDLLKIYSYIAVHNAAAADAFVEDFERKLQNLCYFPFIGRERASLASGLRSLAIGNYVLFYAVTDREVVVVRVIDGRMDLDEEFRR